MNDSPSQDEFDEETQKILQSVGQESIEYGLAFASTKLIDSRTYPQPIQEKRASFVTIKIEEKLRGCMGSLKPRMPLVSDVSHNAFAAAFNDPRFPSLSRDEFEKISIGISVLSPSSKVEFASQEDLLDKLQPKTDGFILRYRQQTGTFLPVVWENISEPEQFLKHLKAKAGLSPDFWSEEITIERFTATCF